MSTTDVWSYIPQQVFEEAHTVSGVLHSEVGPRSDVTGTTATPIDQTQFRLEYPVICDSTEVASMVAFYDARFGAYESFRFTSPNDGLTYTVRFASDLRAVYTTPGAASVRTIIFQSIGSMVDVSAAFGASTVAVGGFAPATTSGGGFQTHVFS